MEVSIYGCVYCVIAWCLFVRATGLLGTAEGIECVQTISQKPDVVIRPLSVEPAEQYGSLDPSSVDDPVSLNECSLLTDSKMAFNWDLPKSTATGDFGSEANLCLKWAYRNLTEELSCYTFSILSSEQRHTIHCWAGIPSFQDIILIKAHVLVEDLKVSYSYYSEVHTLNLTDLCTPPTMSPVRPVHGCNSSGRFTLTSGAEVKTITAMNTSDVESNLPFYVSKQTVEFRLPEEMRGSYNLTIVIFRPDVQRYYTFVHPIHVYCGPITPPTFTPPTTVTPGPSFPVFASIVVVSMILLFLGAIACYAVWHHKRRTPCCQGQRHSNGTRDNAQISRGDNSGNITNGGNQRSYLPLNTSRTSDPRNSHDDDAGKSLIPPETASIPREQSDVTLNVTEMRGAKEIMFLPLSYDHYIRDIVECLRRVFSFQDRVSCKCIHDQQVQADYSANTFDWTDRLLRNENSIVLVPCFSSLKCMVRNKSCVDDILEQCKLDKHKPRCRLVFLNLTGIDYGQNDYHGETFIVREAADCKGLVSSMFAACGFNAEAEQDVVTATLKSEDYKTYIRKLLHIEGKQSDKYVMACV